jgi:biopolymer transport protein ExbD
MTPTPQSRRSQRKSKVYHPTRPLKLWHDQAPQSEDVRIDLVPLIDVIFCILTFFILGAVGLSRQQAIGLDLPKASTGTPQMREMLVVTLDDLSQLYVEKQPVNRNQLLDSLKNYHQYNPNGLMVLNASRNVSYNDVVQVLDLLRQVGGDRVALATLPGSASSTNGQNPFDPNSPNFGTPSGVPGNSGTTLPTDPNNPFSSTTPNSTIPGVPNSTIPGMPNSTNPGMPNSPIPGMPNSTSPGMPNSSTVPNAPPNSLPDRLPKR